MDVAAHQFSGGSIDHPVSFQRRNARKGGRGDDDVEMAAFPRSRVAFVLRTVVADFEQGRVQRGFEREAKAIRARGGHEGSLVSTPRSKYRMMPKRKTRASGNEIQTLKVTQSASLRVMATQMFTKPSTT